MEKLKLESLMFAVLAVSVGIPAYSQSYIAPNQMPSAPSPMAPNPYSARPSAIPVIDYSKPPVMDGNAYYAVNGYASPNTYALANQRPVWREGQPLPNNQNAGRDSVEDYGIEYYMSLSYGMATFAGKDMTNEYYDYPMNNVGDTLGDGKAFTFGLGALANRTAWFEIAFTSVSGLKVGPTSRASNQWCPGDQDDYGGFFYDCEKDVEIDSGGSITSTNFGLNVFVPMDDLFGSILGGMLRPYIGAGVGIAFNTVSDYTVYDEVGYGEPPYEDDPAVITGLPGEDGENAGFYEYDGLITHFGATTKSMSWNLEVGLEVNIDRKTKIDFYMKRQNLGKVKSRNDGYASYESVMILNPLPSGDWYGCSPEA
jgi:hypothetical protein